MITKVAISIWDNRISPVMDTATHLMVVELDGNQILSRQAVNIPALHIIYKIEFLRKQGFELLICGAISQPMYQMIIASGIKVIPFIRGSIDDVITAYIHGELHSETFYLPGYQNRRRHRRRQNKINNYLRNKMLDR